MPRAHECLNLPQAVVYWVLFDVFILGICLIINNESFPGRAEADQRTGTKVDCGNYALGKSANNCSVFKNKINT